MPFYIRRIYLALFRHEDDDKGRLAVFARKYITQSIMSVANAESPLATLVYIFSLFRRSAAVHQIVRGEEKPSACTTLRSQFPSSLRWLAAALLFLRLRPELQLSSHSAELRNSISAGPPLQYKMSRATRVRCENVYRGVC